MPLAWYIAPYNRRDAGGRPGRYCAMDDYTDDIINTNAGFWSESEILGNRAVVKVRAPAPILVNIGQDPNIERLPNIRPLEAVSILTQAQRARLRNVALEAGYPASEFDAALPDFVANPGDITFRQWLLFVTRRRLKPRYDQPTDTIVLDGPTQSCRHPDSVDNDVSE